MQFESTTIDGLFHIRPERHADHRGYFARTWCRDTFEQQGLEDCTRQCNVSFNHARATVRGMHLQLPPHPEAKLVRCVAGRIFDAVVDLRPDSATYLQTEHFELTAEIGNSLYIPPGLAHGFQTLTENCEVFYHMSEAYYPDLAAGYRWDDPTFGIPWPLPVKVISDRDAALPLFEDDPRILAA